MGPGCARKTGLRPSALDDAEPVDYSAGAVTIAGLVCRRERGRVVTNLARLVVHHSPTGFEIGYGGSGPADLALNVLAAYVPPHSDGLPPVACWNGAVVSATAWRLHQQFKAEFIATMPKHGGRIAADAIRAWIASQMESSNEAA